MSPAPPSCSSCSSTSSPSASPPPAFLEKPLMGAGAVWPFIWGKKTSKTLPDKSSMSQFPAQQKRAGKTLSAAVAWIKMTIITCIEAFQGNPEFDVTMHTMKLLPFQTLSRSERARPLFHPQRTSSEQTPYRGTSHQGAIRLLSSQPVGSKVIHITLITHFRHSLTDFYMMFYQIHPL